MPKVSDTAVPPYRHHKASGQAVVWIGGKDRYLGKWKSPGSRAEYNRVVAEWMAGSRQPVEDAAPITVAEICAGFRRHARNYYRGADGSISRAVANLDESMRPLLKLFGNTAAREFGPLRLTAVRQAMIDAGRARTNINRHVTRVRQIFKWAVENELIPAEVHHGLMALGGLRFGRCGVREAEPVRPVPIERVEPVLPHVSRQVAAMVRLQLLTGMRPGEVVLMRGRDLDTTGELWVFKPAKHKTLIHGHTREIYLGRKAQEIIRPFLKPDLSAYLFSPIDAEAERRETLHLARKTPLSCGNRPGSNKQRKPKRVVGERYDVGTYYNAIRRGCEAAFPLPASLARIKIQTGKTRRRDETLAEWKARLGKQWDDVKRWHDDYRWHPHQLRHTAATELRKQFGLEVAGAILGHAKLETTQIYAERNAALARRTALEVG
jgi:integrase